MFNKSAADEILSKMAENMDIFENDSNDEILDQDLINAAIDHLVNAADILDKSGLNKLANNIDDILKKIAQDKKPPEGAKHKAPKGWFDKMKKDIKKENPKYSEKQINATVGNIWDNELSDKERIKIYKEYGKTKNPNK